MAIFNFKTTIGKHKSNDPNDKLAYYKYQDNTVTFTNPSASIIKYIFLLFFLVCAIFVFVNHKDLTFSFFLNYFSTCPSISISRNFLNGPKVSGVINFVELYLNPIGQFLRVLGINTSLFLTLINLILWVVELLVNTSFFILWVLRFFFA